MSLVSNPTPSFPHALLTNPSLTKTSQELMAALRVVHVPFVQAFKSNFVAALSIYHHTPITSPPRVGDWRAQQRRYDDYSFTAAQTSACVYAGPSCAEPSPRGGCEGDVAFRDMSISGTTDRTILTSSVISLRTNAEGSTGTV